MMRGLNHTILLVAHQAALEFAGYSHAPLLLLRVINEICQLPSAMTISNIMRSRFLDRCPFGSFSSGLLANVETAAADEVVVQAKPTSGDYAQLVPDISQRCCTGDTRR